MNMKRNLQYALLAFVLAVTAWYFVTGRETVEAWVTLPVQFTGMPDGMVVQEGMVGTVQVRVRGPKGLMRGINDRNVVYPLNLSNLRKGRNVYAFEISKTPVSRAFEIMEFNPARVELVADMLISRKVPVRPAWNGKIHSDYRFVSELAQPDRVTVRGPESVVSSIESLSNEPVSLDEQSFGIIEEEAPLLLPENSVAEPGSVRVRLEIGYKTKEVILNVPVEMVGVGEAITAAASPAKVRLRVEAPLRYLRENRLRDNVRVRADLSGQVVPWRGEKALAVDLPENCTLSGVEPASVTVTLDR